MIILTYDTKYNITKQNKRLNKIKKNKIKKNKNELIVSSKMTIISVNCLVCIYVPSMCFI